MKKKCVVVDDIDCILWTRSGAGGSCELFVFRRVLLDSSALIVGIQGEAYPESDFVDSDTAVAVAKELSTADFMS